MDYKMDYKNILVSQRVTFHKTRFPFHKKKVDSSKIVPTFPTFYNNEIIVSTAVIDVVSFYKTKLKPKPDVSIDIYNVSLVVVKSSTQTKGLS